MRPLAGLESTMRMKAETSEGRGVILICIKGRGGTRRAKMVEPASLGEEDKMMPRSAIRSLGVDTGGDMLSGVCTMLVVSYGVLIVYPMATSSFRRLVIEIFNFHKHVKSAYIEVCTSRDNA